MLLIVVPKLWTFLTFITIIKLFSKGQCHIFIKEAHMKYLSSEYRNVNVMVNCYFGWATTAKLEAFFSSDYL